MARRHNREGGRGDHLDYESNRQTTMEVIDGGLDLHPAVDGQSLDEDEDEDEAEDLNKAFDGDLIDQAKN